jgi:hypothetical protein
MQLMYDCANGSGRWARVSANERSYTIKHLQSLIVYVERLEHFSLLLSVGEERDPSGPC